MPGLTPAELLEKALNGESLDGDDAGAGATTEGNTTGDGAGTAVDAAAAGGAGTGADDKQQEQKTGDEPAGAPIASKSGAYTIPYEKLAEARDRAKTLEGENETLRAQLAELTAKQQANLASAESSAQARADAGAAQTQADQNLNTAKAAMEQGVDASLFGDFSEEGIAKGIATLMGSLREELRAELREEAARELKPLKEREAKEAVDGHYGAIYAKHPDANEIVQSVEFNAWVKSLPSFQRNAVAAVFDTEQGGTAEQVIEVFDTFKAQTGKASAPAAQDKGKAPEVQRRVPNSLSEMAGEQHQDIAQQVMASAGTDNAALLERMQDMTPEQIERVMNAILKPGRS